LHAVDRSTAASILAGYLQDETPRQIATVNVDFLRQAHVSDAFRHVINSADLTVADGKPLVWIARYLGLKSCERITGPDIIDLCAGLSVEQGCRIFLLGGETGAAHQAAERLRQTYPGINVCGAYSPPPAAYPFPEETNFAIAAQLREARPDILLVGFGAPKQELWISENIAASGARIAVGVGGTFNFINGRVARAPQLLQSAGLEWCFRLYREPRRLWKRYIRDDLPFFLRLVALEAVSKAGLRRPSVEVVS
jgi:N-acetylglucosaminyldiphosphoundecaprenol N-acetyl-beta-D-mannosaminyltransferase